MERLESVADGTSVDRMINPISQIAAGAPGGKLSTLIFNLSVSPRAEFTSDKSSVEQDPHLFQLLKKDDKTTLVELRFGLLPERGRRSIGKRFRRTERRNIL